MEMIEKTPSQKLLR